MARRVDAHSPSRGNAGGGVLTLPSWEEVRAVLYAEEEPPVDAFTVDGWAERWGVGRCSAERMIRQLVRAGRWERVMVKRRDAVGRILPRPYYRTKLQ